MYTLSSLLLTRINTARYIANLLLKAVGGNKNTFTYKLSSHCVIYIISIAERGDVLDIQK